MLAAVFPAVRTGVALFVAAVVVCANRIRVIGQGAGKQRLHRLIRRALNAGKQANARLRQRLACPGANAAANQRVHPQPGQKTCQGPMAAALWVPPAPLLFLHPAHHTP